MNICHNERFFEFVLIRDTWTIAFRSSHENSIQKNIELKILRNFMMSKVLQKHCNSRIEHRCAVLRGADFLKLGFHGPPTSAGQGPCGFDKGRSLTVK